MRDDSEGLGGLVRVVEGCRKRGTLGPLLAWLDRELGEDGVPRRLPVPDWWPALETLDEAVRGTPEAGAIGARAEGWLRAALRFARPGGSAMFGGEGKPPGRLLAEWAGRAEDRGLETVVRWWFPRLVPERKRPGAPPLPAFAAPSQPLAVLRADWNRRGDWVAVDQRDRGAGGRVEVAGAGVRWLGPSWSTPDSAGAARPLHWSTGPFADAFEWTYRVGAVRIVRSAVFLRGRQMALLAEQVEGPGDAHTMRLDLAPGVRASAVAGKRVLRLTGEKGAAVAIPLALPATTESARWGALTASDVALELSQAKPARRTWLPLLVCWNPALVRRPCSWRLLTVSEKSRVCAPGTAFGAHVAWGRGEGLLVYRSLGRPGLRAVLGHQTRSRFLVGQFTEKGDVVPLLKVDE